VVLNSPKLAFHLRKYVSMWRPNRLNLVFAAKNGTPWDQNLIVKRKLHPLLESLGIRRCGLHAFRHTNGSLMDRLNAPMKIRQERFGHAPGSNITLAIYTHAIDADDRLLASRAIGRDVVSTCGQVGARENVRGTRRRGNSVG